MTEDRRAHLRIDGLEDAVKKHFEDHAKFEHALLENTQLTQNIADNTKELVTLVKGAKGARTFILWVAPIVAALTAAWAWIKTH